MRLHTAKIRVAWTELLEKLDQPPTGHQWVPHFDIERKGDVHVVTLYAKSELML